MAETTVLVCDVCGERAAQTVGIKVGGKGRLKDLCETHLGELLRGTRAPKRGRPAGRKSSTAGARAKATPPRRSRKARAGSRRTGTTSTRRRRASSTPAAEPQTAA